MIKNFFCLSTVPSTGTTFCMHLFDSPAMAQIIMPPGDIFANPLSDLEVLAARRHDTKPDARVLWASSHIYGRRIVGPLLAAGAPVSRESWHASITADDCDYLGLPVKVIAPLRNPVLMAMTAIWKCRHARRQLPVRLWWRRQALVWLTDFWSRHPGRLRLIPVDILAKKTRDDREAFLRPIMEDFLGIGLDALNQDVLAAWGAENSTGSAWPADWAGIRRAVEAGEDVRGRDSRLDAEIDYYLSRRTLKRMYHAHGYTGWPFGPPRIGAHTP